jgi:hypothetical protein
MTERTLVIDQQKLSYDGLFDLAELYRLIDSWFYEKGWDKYEHINEEQTTPEGRQIRLVLEPWKSITDYFKIIIRIKANFNDIKDIEVEKEGKKVRLNQGEVKMIFDGYVLSDRHGRWNKKPFLWFLSIIFNKYLFKENYNKAERWLLSDLDDFYQRIKSFLNTYKYDYSTPASPAPSKL